MNCEHEWQLGQAKALVDTRVKDEETGKTKGKVEQTLVCKKCGKEEQRIIEVTYGSKRDGFAEIVKRLMDGEKIEWIMYEGYTLNPKKEHVDLIVEGLKAKDGYCPCKVGKEPQNVCPCDDFINTGKCCCKLWVER
jgi:hypothetical protein